MKLPMAVFALIFAAAEPIMPGVGDLDLFKYAATQGGLFLLVLVLLWTIRRDSQRQREEDKRQSDDDKQQTTQLVDLVVKATIAMQASTDSTHRVARALENLQRPGHQRRGDD